MAKVPSKETVVFRDDKGKLVSRELDDGLPFDVIVAAREPRTESNRPDATERLITIRKQIWELVAEGGALPKTVARLAQRLRRRPDSVSRGTDHRSGTHPSGNPKMGHDYKSLEKRIRAILRKAINRRIEKP
jgi:hypothetical protein